METTLQVPVARGMRAQEKARRRELIANRCQREADARAADKRPWLYLRDSPDAANFNAYGFNVRRRLVQTRVITPQAAMKLYVAELCVPRLRLYRNGYGERLGNLVAISYFRRLHLDPVKQ